MELNNLKPAEGSKHAKRRSAVVSAPVWARLLAVVTRVRSRVRAAFTRLASKAVKCRCNVACRSVASPR